jgi:hypothetical protein
VIDIELKVNFSNHKLLVLTCFLTLTKIWITKIFHNYSQYQFNIYGTLRNEFCYLKLIFSRFIHLLIFFLNAHDCLAIVVFILIFKLHLFQMIRIVERAVSSDSSCVVWLNIFLVFFFQEHTEENQFSLYNYIMGMYPDFVFLPCIVQYSLKPLLNIQWNFVVYEDETVNSFQQCLQ